MDCSICLNPTEKFVRKLSCSHEFHRYCLDEWLTVHHTCPICRSEQFSFNQWMDSIFEAANFTLPKKDDKDVLKLLDYGLAAHFDVSKHQNSFCIVSLFIRKKYSEDVIFKAIDCGFEFYQKQLPDDMIAEKKIYYDKLEERTKHINVKSMPDAVYKETIEHFIKTHLDDKRPETLEEFDHLVSMTLIHINISNVLFTAVKANRLDFVKIMLKYFPIAAWLSPFNLTQRKNYLIKCAPSDEMKNFLLTV